MSLPPLSACRRPLMLAAAALLFCVAFAATASHPLQATACGPDCVSEPTGNHIYYTDSTFKTIFCETSCNGDTCNGETTPYELFRPICCCL